MGTAADCRKAPLSSVAARRGAARVILVIFTAGPPGRPEAGHDDALIGAVFDWKKSPSSGRRRGVVQRQSASPASAPAFSATHPCRCPRCPWCHRRPFRPAGPSSFVSPLQVAWETYTQFRADRISFFQPRSPTPRRPCRCLRGRGPVRGMARAGPGRPVLHNAQQGLLVHRKTLGLTAGRATGHGLNPALPFSARPDSCVKEHRTPVEAAPRRAASLWR